MTGQTFIGGKDIYKDFGVVITKGGYNELLNYNEIKAPESNNWPEDHGVEVDLSAVVLNSRTLQIPFYCTDFTKAEAFMDMLETPGEKVLSSTFLTKGYNLRMNTQSSVKSYRQGERTFTVSFTEDKPQVYTYTPVNYNKVIPRTALSVDNIPVQSFGLIYTGSFDNWIKRAKAKDNLSRNLSGLNGAIYDTGIYKSEAFEITIPLLFYIKGEPYQKPKYGDFNADYNGDFLITRWIQQMGRADMTEFINLYESFLGLLTKPGERTVSYKGVTKKAYYKKAGNFNILSVAPHIAVSFDLTMVCTQSEKN